MDAVFQSFPMLALPLELRFQIYRELLSPDPGRCYILWDVKNRREAAFNIYPAIVQVSKQTYSEAISILYDNNNFQVNMSRPMIYPDCEQRTDVKLFRRFPSSGRSITNTNRPLLNPVKIDFKGQKTLPALTLVPGLIYPHAFQRLRHIELFTYLVVTGPRSKPPYLSFPVPQITTILEILRILAKEKVHHASVLRKNFNFAVWPNCTERDWFT